MNPLTIAAFAQAAAAIAVAILTWKLITTTRAYTDINQQTLNLGRDQFERQWKPDLQVFILYDRVNSPVLQMVNLAHPSAVVTGLRFQFGQGATAKSHRHRFIHPVPSYGEKKQDIRNLIEFSARHLYPHEVGADKDQQWQSPISIGVDYHCAGKANTSPFAEGSITLSKGQLINTSFAN